MGWGGGWFTRKQRGQIAFCVSLLLIFVAATSRLNSACFLENFWNVGHRDAVFFHLRNDPLGRRCDDDQRGDYGPGDGCYVVDHDLYGYGPGSSRGKIRFFCLASVIFAKLE